MTSSETFTSIIQDLSFESASDDIETVLGPGSFGKLPLRCRDGSFNNFALLLSDQCPWSFEILSGQYGTLHRCSGSILRQVEDVLLQNKRERHLRGGEATKQKYLYQKKFGKDE